MRVDHDDSSASDLRRRFDAVAGSFDGADYVHRSTFEGLLERLAPVAVKPGLILDLGSATGSGSDTLSRTVGRSDVLGVDVSSRMLQRGAGKRRWFSRVRQVQADVLQLPVADGSVELVFANMLLPWIDDPDACFAEVSRVLRKDAVFAFASLGPDSMQEFREAVEGSEGALTICTFPDMHDIGDGLVRAGLRDPVLDVDRLRITWPTFDAMLDDLLACGAIGGPSGGTIDDFRALQTRFPGPNEAGLFAIELELVFGHAWGSGPRHAAGEFRVEPGAIGRRGRR